MYSAKTMGKNRIRFFSPEMEDSVNNRHRIQTMLRQALKESTISPVYQAKVCSKTGKMVACEALARWRTEDGTFISPAEFVPIAEHTGMILQLGNLVFRKAAQQAVKWRRAGRELNIAVNISPNELRNVGFVDQLQKTLEETQAEPSWFELEITEYAMMEDVEHAMKVVHRLSDLGFRIGIDDFGTGYSSLSYLKHFHIHTLKIDRSFVSDITRKRKSEAVVHSIVSLGQGLGLSVVAEGVETAEQAALLRQIGCDEMQGYFFGKPMTAEQLEEQLSVSHET
jgi:EAL domain-containing protein (putative c-di-GMP-specific phosphodiesterase class I)